LSLTKVAFRALPVTEPPIPEGGGRIFTPAGELAQILNGQAFAFVAYVEFLPNASQPRGNHYHLAKTEMLYVITGHLKAVYKELDSGLTEARTLSSGDLVTILPGCAHVYYALEHTRTIEISDTRYDPADTLPFRLDDS